MRTLLDMSLAIHPRTDVKMDKKAMGVIQKLLNESLKTEIPRIFGKFERGLHKNLPRIDKIFLEAVSGPIEVTKLNFSQDFAWLTLHIRNLHKIYKPEIIGIEDELHYDCEDLFIDLSKKRIGPFKKIFSMLSDSYANVRTYDFAKNIDKELKDGEIGISYHGSGHDDLRVYLSGFPQPINIVPVNPPHKVVEKGIFNVKFGKLFFKSIGGSYTPSFLESWADEEINKWYKDLEVKLQSVRKYHD